jgi:protein-tyrosine phosphatase
MIKILMVCLGNICRSPMAEGILRARLEEAGVDAMVDSAGTSAWHRGEPPDERAVEECLKNGVDITAQRSRPFTKADFADFDLIYVMDDDNFRDVMHLAADSKDKQKVHLLMDVVYPGKRIPVPDPWYGGQDGFARVFRMLDAAAQQLTFHFQKR